MLMIIQYPENAVMFRYPGIPMTEDFTCWTHCLGAVKRVNRTITQPRRTVAIKRREVLLPMYGKCGAPFEISHLIPVFISSEKQGCTGDDTRWVRRVSP